MRSLTFFLLITSNIFNTMKLAWELETIEFILFKLNICYNNILYECNKQTIEINNFSCTYKL